MIRRKGKGKRRGKRHPGIRIPPLAMALALGGLLLAGPAAAIGWLRCGTAGCPDPEALVPYIPGGAPTLLDRHGIFLAELHPVQGRVVPLESLPPHLPAAFIAVEDRRFRSHRGVDWVRTLGAAVRNVTSPGRAQGASTLTMQLARSVFPEEIPREERTLRRKVVEARVAGLIERRYPKDTVLELYLNHVYLGTTIPGVEAAARHLFAREAAELQLHEAALLASLARAPALYDPRRHPERAQARRDLVLSLMEAQGLVEAADAEAARGEPLGVTPEPAPPEPSTAAPYFVEVVRQELLQVLGRQALVPGLRVQTTLDPVAQAAAEAALGGQLAAVEGGRFGRYGGPRFDPLIPGGPAGTPYLQGAVVVLDVGGGDVLALVGGRDWAHSRYNRAVTSRRPTGSAFKPFIFAAALEHGFLPSQPILDRPFRLTARGSEPWTPRNHDGSFRGPVGMEEALVRSLNIPTARLGMAVGIPEVTATARRAGFQGEIPLTPSVTLGTAAASPLEVATAYATLAGLGIRPAPRFILRVEDADGTLLHSSSPRLEEGMDPRVAWLVTRMLQEAVDRGTGTAARAGGLRGPVAGKTGTTQEGADVWFAGYTPEVVAAVWMGFDRPAPILSGASGGTLAAPVWGRTVAPLLADRPGRDAPAGWPRPPGLVERTVDPATGLGVPPGCPTAPTVTATRLFLEEATPTVAGCREEPGILSRFAGAVRGFFRRGREEPPPPPPPSPGAAPWNGSLSMEELRADAPHRGEAAGVFLGMPRVPVATGGE